MLGATTTQDFSLLSNIPILIGTFRCDITRCDILLMRYENSFHLRAITVEGERRVI